MSFCWHSTKVAKGVVASDRAVPGSRARGAANTARRCGDQLSEGAWHIPARWLRLINEGARPQRLLWASTSTKDSEASDVLYLQALVAPFTITTVPEATLRAFADHGWVGDLLPPDGGDCEEVLDRFRRAGIDIDALAAQLQREGAEAFDKSWGDLLDCIASKSGELKKSV